MLLSQIFVCGHYDIGNNCENELKLFFKSFHHSYIAYLLYNYYALFNVF